MGDPKFPTPESIDWMRKLKQALETALEVGILERIKDDQDALLNDFLEGRISGSDFDIRDGELDIPQGTIKIESVTDFAACLSAYGLPPEEVAELVAHESSHFESARAKGVNPYFQVQLARSGSDMPHGSHLYPSTNFKFPASMDDGTRRKILREIIEAAENLSPRDLAQLGRGSESL